MENILIVGGGVAGLSAGIFAQMRGYNAIICEKHDILGGNLTGWNREGYHIDNCIHWLTGTNKNTPLYATWVQLGALGSVEVYQGESLYTYERSGRRLSLCRDINKLAAQMLEVAPEDRKAISSFITAIKTVQGLEGIAGRAHNLKYSIVQKLRYTPALAKYAFMSVKNLAEKFKNAVVKGFLSCLLPEHFSSLALIYVFATITGENGGVPCGGSLKMAERMTARFKALGGRIMTDKEVVKINMSGDKARSATFSDGSEVIADAFIVTADPKTVFGKMLDVKMPSDLEKLYASEKFKRFSSFQCAFSCEGESLPFCGDFIFDLPEKYGNLLSSKYLILREFSHEKSFAPEGKNVVQAMIFCDEKASRGFIQLKKNKIAYAAKKQYISNVILQAVTEKLPELKDRLEIIDTWSPATYNRYLSSEIGSYMSFTLPAKVVPPHVPTRIKGIGNVFLATQWQGAVGGLPTAAEAGKRAVAAIDGKNAAARAFVKEAQQKKLGFSD